MPLQSPRTATPAADAADAADVITLEGELIEVPVVVSDRSGRYVPGLDKGDFRVLEDGRAQDVTLFHPERVPFNVAILIDTSASTRDTLPRIKEAAIGLISQLGPGDRALVISFAQHLYLQQDFTADKAKLFAAVRQAEPEGKTRLYDAVFATVNERLNNLRGRKAMVILSDGQDTGSSGVTSGEAMNVCRETDLVVYGVRYPETPDSPRYAPPSLPPSRWPQGSPPPGRIPFDRDLFMEAVTKSSGGAIYYAESIADVAGLCNQIAEELRHVYTIGYQPQNALKNGGFRRITVEVPSRPNAAIRHRLGYIP